MTIFNVTGTESDCGGHRLNREPIDVVQNQTAVTATINSTSGFGLATSPAMLPTPKSVDDATFMGPAVAVTMGNPMPLTDGMVTAGCPCPFTATARRSAITVVANQRPPGLRPLPRFP